MASRPVFVCCDEKPYFETFDAEFVYNGGFALSQKQKNIRAVHEELRKVFPDKKVLDISSKSTEELGVELSAFRLKKYVPSLGKRVSVENVFQSGKVFEGGGPYRDLMNVSPGTAKRDERLRTSGALTGFRFEGQNFPNEPKTVFYDYIYMNALLENEALAEGLMEYDAFTDIEFIPDRSINCQAKSAAAFVTLSRLGMLDKIKNFEDFIELF